MHNNDLDEKPVSGVQKTFEELIEEKLRKEIQEPVIRREFPKREFLRKKNNSAYYNKDTEQNDKSKEEEDEYKPTSYQKPIKNLNRDLSADKILIKPNLDPQENPKKKQFLKKGEGKISLSVNNKPDKADIKPEPQNCIPPKSNQKKIPIKSASETKIENKIEDKIKLKAPEKPAMISTKPINDETIYYDINALDCEQIEFTKVREVEKPVQNKLEEEYNEKLLVVSEEIKRFKTETMHKKQGNRNLKSELAGLERELEEYTEYKNNRIQELKLYRENEIKRIKRERLNLEKSSKAQQPTKTDEIEELRSLLFKIQEDLAIKEFKDKEKLEDLALELSKIQTEINELEVQVKIREQLLIKERFKKPNPKGISEKVFKNGTKVKNYPDGRCIINFQNGDTKETHPDGTIIYQYSKDQITQITLPDGTEISEFSNGQIEKLFPDGKKEITFPNGSVQVEYSGSSKKAN